jgi:hypothetical protein
LGAAVVASALGEPAAGFDVPQAKRGKRHNAAQQDYQNRFQRFSHFHFSLHYYLMGIKYGQEISLCRSNLSPPFILFDIIQ